MLINYLIEKGEDDNTEIPKNINRKQHEYGKNQRIRVNDKTATGGWF